MSLEAKLQQDIKLVFEQEIEGALMLLKSLDQEYQALAEHHVSTLEEVVNLKQERVSQLELISQQRERLLASLDASSSNANSKQRKAYKFNNDKELEDLWDKLVYIAEKCREKNRVNGSIVELVSKQSRHALDILQGILPESTAISELYDNSGHATKTAHKRSLVQV